MRRASAIAGQILRVAGLVLMLGPFAIWMRGPVAALGAAHPFEALIRTIVAVAKPAIAAAVQTPQPSSASVVLADRFYRAIKQKDYATAIPYGTQYLAANPQANAFAIDLAYAYFGAGRFAEARAILQERDAYLQVHPEHATLWLDLAYKEGAAKRYVRAIDDLDTYLQYHPGDVVALRQRSYDVAAVTPAAPATPDPAALFYAAVKAGKYDQAVALGRQYLAVNPSNDAFAIDLAYAEISAKWPAAAAEIAQSRMEYIRANPKAASLLAALFYAYNAGRTVDSAVGFGDQYLALRPDDNAFAIDLAYADLNLGRTAAARTIASPRAAYLQANPAKAKIWMAIAYKDADAKQYRLAVADADTYLALEPTDVAARAQRTAFVNAIWGGPRYQNFGYAQYESRFQDTFFGVDQTYALAPAARVQPYAALYLTEDLRSGPPGSPQIYSDNALIADLGLRSHFGPYVVGFLEAGAGIGLRGQGTITDLRYGARYFQQWGARTQPYTTVNASAAFYSRYGGNFIGYYTTIHDFGGKTIRPVIGINGGLDSHNVFGNNYIEGLAGFQTGTNALSFRLVQVEGTYLTRGLNPAPKAAYSGIRASVFFGLAK
jgi:thioredoxin-like negative regulator of GroEL